MPKQKEYQRKTITQMRISKQKENQNKKENKKTNTKTMFSFK